MSNPDLKMATSPLPGEDSLILALEEAIQEIPASLQPSMSTVTERSSMDGEAQGQLTATTAAEKSSTHDEVETSSVDSFISLMFRDPTALPRVLSTPYLDQEEREFEAKRRETRRRRRIGRVPLYLPVEQWSLCWRCGYPGHNRSVCSGPQRLFCSRCGLYGTMSRDCPCPTETNRSRTTRRKAEIPVQLQRRSYQHTSREPRRTVSRGVQCTLLH